MGWERIAENKIREALQQGEFDNLPGAGKPVDLDDYFKQPEHLPAIRRELTNRRTHLAIALERARRS
jgi:hypothetical protein